MTGKERVMAALEHRKTDRFPLAYEATFEVTENLIRHFGLDKDKDIPVSQIQTFQSPVGEKEFGVDHEIILQKKLGVDLAKVICPISKDCIGNWFGLPLVKENPDGTIVGAWNIGFRRQKYNYGTYIELDSYPLAGVESLDEFINYPKPSLDLWDFDALEEVVPKYKDFFVLLNMNGCFDFARFIRGTEEFFVDLMLEPRKAEILLDKVNDFAIELFEECMKRVGDQIDGVYCGDDFGSQRGLVISPELWRKYIKPRYKKLVSVVKSYGKKYFHHSCGGVRPIIPDMIEIGFDVLNPIQPRALGMDPKELSEEFGKDITFYGAIDEQHTLPFGTAEDVRNEVIDRINTLGKYGGYIVAPSHGFQPDTPIENILTMYETVLGHKLE